MEAIAQEAKDVEMTPKAKKKEAPAAPPAAETVTRGKFIKGLLAEKTDGMTWKQIQAALVGKFGKAPKKRSVLYGVLKAEGTEFEKITGEKREVTYKLKTSTKAPATA